MQHPSAMCWPLSGGGSGSPSRCGQGLHGAAEGRPRLEDGDVVAGFGEVERGREPGEPAADDDRPHSAATARTLPTAESLGRLVKTS